MLKRFAHSSGQQHHRNYNHLTITAPHLCTPSPSPSPDLIHQPSSTGLVGYNRGDLVGCGLGGGCGYYLAAGEDAPFCEGPSMPDRVPGQPFRGQPSTPLRSVSPYFPDTPSPMPDEHPVSPTLVEKFRALNRPSSSAHRQQLGNLGHRSAHRRLPSGSSIGSAGPESPYTHSIVNPHIVGLDTPPASSPYPEPLEIGYQGSAFSQAPTSLMSSGHSREFLAPEFQNLDLWSTDPDNVKAAELMMRGAMEEHWRSARAGRQRSRLANRSPYETVDEEEPRLTAGPSNPVPTLDRTVSDAYQDELYNPAMAGTMSAAADGSPYASQNYSYSQQNQQFSKILQAANEKHLSARPAMPISREHSPFRQTSEFATERFPHTASTPHSPATRLNPAGSPREPQEMDAAARNYHLPAMQRDTASARTISPKESLLRHHEAEADAKAPLFPSSESLHRRENQFPSHSNSRHLAPSDVENHEFHQRYDHPRTNNRPNFSTSATTPTLPGPDFTFLSPSLPSIPSNANSMPLQTPKQYPFMSNPRRQASSRRSFSDSDPDPQFPALLSSMESTRSETDQPQLTRFMSGGEAPQPSSSSSDVERPSDTAAGTGPYTCTVPGCPQRFETSVRLQKHKRESHRGVDPAQRSPATPTVPSSSTSETLGQGGSGSRTTPTAPSAAGVSASSSTATAGAGAATNAITTTTTTTTTTPSTANRNNQAGPHKCTRPNPNSNKPCNTVFSRSYDLTRHEETVHNRSKVKIQCALCTVEKTFSRGDALSRHVRVMHPGADYPGKTKKRGS